LIIHYIGRGREMSLKKKKAKYESYEFKWRLFDIEKNLYIFLLFFL
jgi:hypothetical protein